MTRRDTNFAPPTVEDLQETRRANEKLVLAALESKPEWVETELAKTTGLALSHLRAALASLLDQGRVRRLPGTGTRAVYGMADPGLADVPATPLTDDAVEIRDYLRGRADSALHMGEELRMTRDDVMSAVSLLNAHGMITCTFVGNLVIFRLKEAGEGEETGEGTKPKKTAKKAKADEDGEAPPKKAPRKTAGTTGEAVTGTEEAGAPAAADGDAKTAKPKRAPARRKKAAEPAEG